MLWVPGVDEIPLSIMSVDSDEGVSLAVKNVGDATQSIHALKTGSLVGIRGPFGNKFDVSKSRRTVLVAGGTGIAPLMFLLDRLRDAKAITFLYGAKTKTELAFLEKLEQLSAVGRIRLVSTTEDGSCGLLGLCTEPFEEAIVGGKNVMVYACGPEKMIRQIYELCEKHDAHLQVSLERLMRCSIGLCSSCAIGRFRVCRDGPVFSREQLREVRNELGSTKLDFDGHRIRI